MIIERLLKVALLGSTWVMYLMLALSVISIGAAIERWWFFRKHEKGDELGDELCAKLEEGDGAGAEALLARHGSIEAQIIAKGIRWVDGGPDALGDSIASELAKKKKDLERGMNLLGTLGNNAPFIGLFGTVIGVIEAFHQLSAGQDKAAMGNVMNGIAEALVATGVGLFVAIPAVVAYNIFSKKIDEVETNVDAITKQLTSLLKAARYVRENGRATTVLREAEAGTEPMPEQASRAIAGSASAGHATPATPPAAGASTPEAPQVTVGGMGSTRLAVADAAWDGME